MSQIADGHLHHYASLLGDASLLRANDSNQPPALADISLDLLDYHGIAMLALHAGSLPPQLANPLKARKAMMVANEALKLPALTELAEAFAAKSLQPIVFKGTALAHSIYPHAWLRPRTDTDLFCDVEQLQEVADVLVQLGYEKLFAISGHYVSYQSTYSKALSNKVALNIDLHWRINNRQLLARSFSHMELLSRAQPLLSETPLLFRPSMVDSLIIASLHRLGHHHREERLTWLYDIHLLIEQLDDEDWEKLVALTFDKHLTAITLDALQTARDLFASAVPESVLARLASQTEKEKSAIFLQRDLPEWRIFFHELKALPDSSARLRWVGENLLPNADYTRQQMQEPNLFIAHSKRIWRGLNRLRQ